MIDAMTRTRRLVAAAFHAGLALLAISAGSARAQYDSDLFDPYRASYRSSSYPTGGRFGPQGRAYGVAPPGLGNVRGLGGQYDSGTPFEDYSAQQFSAQDRIGAALFPEGGPYGGLSDPGLGGYLPNRDADEAYRRAQQRKDDLYQAAMNEPDPSRKAELLRDYRQLSRRISLGLDSAGPAAVRPNARASGPPPIGSSSAEAPEPAGGLPAQVRSYDDLLRWSQVINRRALDAASQGGPAPAAPE